METPGPLINGERFNPTKVVIFEGSQHSDITDGLISLDYTDEFIFDRDMPWPLAGHQGSMTISKEAWDKALASLPNEPYLYLSSMNPMGIAIFLPDFTLKLFDVRIRSIQKYSFKDIEIRFNLKYVLRSNSSIVIRTAPNDRWLP